MPPKIKSLDKLIAVPKVKVIPRKPAQSRFDVVSVGDATLDLFVNIHDASVMCSLDKQNCWMCLNYGEKIPIQDLQSTIGGNACNNAVGVARLNLKAGFYSIIGDDETGRKIMDRLKKEGVSTEYIHVEKKHLSNYSVVLRFRTERTILVYHEPRHYNLPKLATTQWIYLTSLGKEFQKTHERVVRQLKNCCAKLMFNPGTHQLHAGFKKLEPILKVTHTLILNKEEARSLLGKQDNEQMKDLLRELHHIGPEVAIITDGPKGAYGYDGKQFYRMKPLPAKVLERTGAGDSFATGVLAAFCYGKDLSEALLWGSANAASVVESVGPQAGLLTKAQLLKRICNYKGYCKALK